MPNRRQFLLGAGGALLALGARARPMASAGSTVTLCLLGDVMTGRGIDQVLPHPSPPRIYEGYAKSARLYVELAEKGHGAIPRPVGLDYVWGDALEELEQARPDLRILNLETAVTTSDEPWPGKGIHYRMHPQNVGCLTRAAPDCCVLANNHVLDWGYAGLAETLETLAGAGLATAGAGPDRARAAAAAAFEIPGRGRVVVLACGSTSSGIPPAWAAGDDRAGVNLLADLSGDSVGEVASMLDRVRRPGDLAVVSIHWGGNWGYDVPERQRRFAHRLIDEAGVDVVHGHSSHHPRPLEVYRSRPILYGCGDFLNDYEGISGYEEYRSQLVLMYLVTLGAADGRLVRLTMVPFELRRLQPRRADAAEAAWLAATLSREGRRLGTAVEADRDARLSLAW